MGRLGVAWRDWVFRRVPKIKVLDPTEGSRVSFRQVVYGTIYPPTSVPYVFLLLEDHNWHLQKDAEVSNGRWSVECQFGDPEVTSRTCYKIIAVAGIKIYAGAILPDIPAGGIQSTAVKVYRE